MVYLAQTISRLAATVRLLIHGVRFEQTNYFYNSAIEQGLRVTLYNLFYQILGVAFFQFDGSLFKFLTKFLSDYFTIFP